MNCFTDLANLGSGASPQIVLKSVMEVLSQLFLTPQHDQQYACPILQNYSSSQLLYYISEMTNLVSLQSPGRLLQIDGSGHQLSHVLVCGSEEEAADQLAKFMDCNKGCAFKGEVQDNIGRIEVRDVEGFYGVEDEVEKMEGLKKLLAFIETESKEKGSQGFYYYSKDSREVKFYRTSMKQTIKEASIIATFSLYSYLLSYCTDLKDYISIWRQVTLKRQPFAPVCRNKTKVDQFIASLVRKEIQTVKMAYHTIQIAIQRIKWIQNVPAGQQKGQEIKGSINYSDMKINLAYKNQSPRKLKHSTSMTNLSSSQKGNRKYKKASPQLKNQKLFKENSMKTCKSFWNTNMANTFKATNTFLGNKSTTSNFLKESALLESFAKINQANLEKNVINQSDLLELLQKKEKNRKMNEVLTQKDYRQRPIKAEKDAIVHSNRLEIDFVQKSKRQLKIQHRNIDIQIQPLRKSTKLKMNYTIFSLNETLFNSFRAQARDRIQKGPGTILNKSQFTLESQKMVSTQKKVQTARSQEKRSLNQIKESKIQPFFISNTTFLYETIKILCIQKALRRYFLVTLYAVYIYSFTVIFSKEKDRNKELQDKDKQNLISIAQRIDKVKSNPKLNSYFLKGLNQNNMKDIEYLLQQVNKLSDVEANQIQKVTLRVLKKEFQKNKLQIVSEKLSLIKSSTFKSFLLYMMRVSISISVIIDPEKQNCGVVDFNRYEQIINNMKNDNQIDLMAELRNCESFF